MTMMANKRCVRAMNWHDYQVIQQKPLSKGTVLYVHGQVFAIECSQVGRASFEPRTVGLSPLLLYLSLVEIDTQQYKKS